MKLRRHEGFTLIELLMVLAVLIALIAFVMAGTGSTRARELNRAGNLVADMAAQASRMAKTRNSLCALVVVTEAEHAEENFRLLTILERPIGEASWKQVAKWEMLPQAIVVDEQETRSSFLKSASPQPDPPPPVLNRATAYAYQVFLPDGRILNSENPSLFLREERAGESPKNYYEIVLNANTSTPIIRRP